MAQTSTGTGTTNATCLDEIREVIAGGVSSSMRAHAIPSPLVVQRASGCRLWDVEGNELIDLNMGYGPHVFGYTDGEVLDKVADQFTRGHMTGLPHVLDRQAGELIAAMVPAVEQVRFANSGTEAVASALRLARAATGRPLVLTFEGHYHGWSETVLRAGKATLGVPGSATEGPLPGAPGMIPEALNHTLQVPWNDLPALRALFDSHGDHLAAVICEPVLVNSFVMPPAPGFLKELRALCTRWGTWLIFDEVITGFRVARGGAQERYGIEPELTILSKVMGGGFPVAAFGGRRREMALLADNTALHAGVYAGNHAAVRATVSTLSKLRRRTGLYEELEAIGGYTEHRLREMLEAEGRLAMISRVGSLMSVALLRHSVDLSAGLRAAASAMDFPRHRRFQIRAQAEGVYFHPNPLEPWFLSTAHTTDDIDKVVAALRRALPHPDDEG
jgi:glutamate-1-semialdehyde 2,1-aminomutase